MELESTAARFKAEGVHVAAVSYDTHEILSHFATRMGGFSYPLLSDPDSEMIKAFGILNRNVAEGHAFFGMARPVTFLVDSDGVVTSKYFGPGHRQRVTADSILVREYGVDGGTRAHVKTRHLELVAYPSQDVARRGNRITLVMELDLPDKMHVYAPGVEGYTPVSVAVADEPYLRTHETSFPESEVMLLPAIGEAVPVYHGRVRILQDVTLSPRLPGYDKDETVELEIPATISYQACDDTVCYVPEKVPITFKLQLTQHDGERVPEGLRKKATSSSN